MIPLTTSLIEYFKLNVYFKRFPLHRGVLHFMWTRSGGHFFYDVMENYLNFRKLYFINIVSENNEMSYKNVFTKTSCRLGTQSSCLLGECLG